MERIQALLPEFQGWLENQEKSNATVSYYIKRAKMFAEDMGNMRANEITREVLESWSKKLKSRASHNYTSTCLWAIYSFVKFLREEKGIENRGFQEFRIPNKKLPEYIDYLEGADLPRILESIDTSDVHGLRLRAYLELLLHTGLRPSEALSLGRDIVHKTEIEVIGKGNKKRMVGLPPRANHWLAKYIDSREDSEASLFVTHCDAKEVSLRQMQDQFKKHVRKIGMDKTILYWMRHTFATNLLENGCPLPFIQFLLGNSKPETTQIYYTSVQKKNAIKAQMRYVENSYCGKS